MDEISKGVTDAGFIRLLKQMKKEGKLDTEECRDLEVYKWRNTIQYGLLESWLTGEDEEPRLDTLELLAISKKSTLCFTSQELDLIIIFLKCNIKEKIEHVPLIQKVLKRLNDSYLVLKRQYEKENKANELKNARPSLTSGTTEKFSNVQSDIRNYQNFVNALHAICIRNLYPGAINARRKTSLQILCLINDFLCDDLKRSLYNVDNYKILFDCVLLDTYETNKGMAYASLKSSGLTNEFFDTKEKLIELVVVAVQLANNVRPLDCIAAAYMLRIGMRANKIQELLLQLTKCKMNDCISEQVAFLMISLLKINLQNPVKLAKEKIVIATSKHSLYGNVFCIHSILSTINLSDVKNDEHWRQLVTEIVNMCFELNNAVAEIVNNSSPEGHLPMDLDARQLNCISSDDNNVVVTAQRVLLCSWRTVKEISLFFGFLTEKSPIYSEKTKNGLLTENQIKEIGNQLVTLLCETKHRGAFEQAHVGFQQLCNRLWHLTDEHNFLKNLPKFWLQQIFMAIIGLTTENSKLCATRRSAGVPFMVQALVCSEMKKRGDAKKYIFHSVMRTLLKLVLLDGDLNLNEVKTIFCNETLLFDDSDKFQYLNDLDKTEKECVKLNEITEIKSHALNILRALYRHSLLGDLVKEYTAAGFMAAFKSYDGKSWAERNAATLLFSSLMVRVFGVQRTKDHVNLSVFNKMSGKIFFDKYPAMLPFLLKELSMFVNSPEDQIKPKIQCMLLILSRLLPSFYSSNANDESNEKTSSWKVDEFVDLVSACGNSRVWKIRELAARALVPLVTEKNIHSVCCDIMQQMTLPLSSNLLHGFTLQFLQLTKSTSFESIEFSQEDIQKLINIAIKLLENLENSETLACYPAATAVLEIIIELSKMNTYSYMHKDTNFLNLHTKIQAHLKDNSVLKKKPGIELYEVAAVNLLLTENYYGSLVNNEYLSAQFFDYLLKHKNEEVLSISWSKLIYVIQKTKNEMLYDLGFLKAIKTLDKPANDPDLQESIYDFLYRAIQEMEVGSDFNEYAFSDDDEKVYMCMHIFTKLNASMKTNEFYPRKNFFKLFARAFGYLLRTRKDTELTMTAKKSIYDAISTYSTMESNIDCRIGISEVMPLLYIEINESTKTNNMYLILEWWTAFLQLLYDDNNEVRTNAALLVCKMMPETRMYCETIVTDTFFVKFVALAREATEAVGAACFCWSMKSAAVLLEEMDETDVFNKSYNYECFEPLHIARNCIVHLRSMVLKHNVTALQLSKPVKEWLQKELNLSDNFKFETLNELIGKYKDFLPDCERPLNRILDPGYPAKLINETVYEEIKKAVIRKTA